MSALKDPQGLGSYEAACWFREHVEAGRETPASAEVDDAPRHTPEQARGDESEHPDPDRS
jgi:hypothetical protein